MSGGFDSAEGQVKTKGRDLNRFFVNLDTRYLCTKNLSQLGRRQSAVVFLNVISNDSAESLNEKNSRPQAGSRIFGFVWRTVEGIMWDSMNSTNTLGV